MQKLPIVVVQIVTSITINMYVYKHYLGIQDKDDYKKWQFSKLYDTIDECFAKAKEWLLEHPGRHVSFMQKRVYVPDPSKGAQS